MPTELRGHRLFQRFRQPVKCFLQYCPRAGDIDSFEAFTILAEDGATVQPELCFVDDQIFSFCFCQPKLSEIQPDQVGSLWLDQMNAWQIIGNIITGKCKILLQISF